MLRFNCLVIGFLLILPFALLGQKKKLETVQSKLDSLYYLGNSLVDKKDLSAAYVYFVEADSLARSAFGDKSKEYALATYQEAKVEFKMRNISLAKQHYFIASILFEKFSDLDKDAHANILGDLGKISADEGNFMQAESYFLREIKFRDSLLGKINEKSATAYLNLGITASRHEDFNKAIFYFEKCLECRAVLTGKQSISYANALYNLAKVYSALGNYNFADSLFQVDLDLLRNLAKTNTMPYIGSLVELAYIKLVRTEFSESEKLLTEAYKLFQVNSIFQKNSAYGWCLVTMATYYRYTGQLNKSLEFYLLAKDVMYSISPKLGWDYYSVIRNIGRLYMEMGAVDEAQIMLESILNSAELSEEVKTLNFPYIKEILYRLYLEKGISVGESDLLDLVEKLSNRGPLSKVSAHELLALWKMNKGKYSDAVLELKIALKITIDSLSFFNTPSVKLRSLLSRAYYKLNQCDSSIHYLVVADSIRKENIIHAVCYMSEEELSQHTHYLDNTIHSNIACIADKDEDYVELLYKNVLFNKGFLLQTRLKRENWIRTDSVSLAWSDELKKMKRKITFQSNLDSNHEIYPDKIEERLLELERKINNRIIQNSTYQVMDDWKSIQSKLKNEECSVEFLKLAFPSQSGLADSIVYVALLLKKDIGKPKLIYLCTELELAAVVSTNKDRRFEYISKLYKKPDFKGLYNESEKSLFTLILKPILPHLKGINTVYYSPEGLLHQINLDALHAITEDNLQLRKKFVLISSTKQLVEAEKGILESHTNLCLIGGLEYNFDSTQIGKKDNIAYQELSRRGDLSFYNNTIANDLRKWTELPGTKKEIDRIENIFLSKSIPVDKLDKNSGTEQHFYELGKSKFRNYSPKVIHIASHAYFYEKSKISQNDSLHVKYNGIPEILRVDDPMIRSGIVLSGANKVWSDTLHRSNESEDGVLTAFEISLMDLSNTELVVLSACETGLGEIRGEEGVYGLQRAFKIAGVNKIMMSLWKVPDKQTTELMELFYKNWVQNKMSVRAALSSAQNTMNQRGWEPFYWAGFVLME